MESSFETSQSGVEPAKPVSGSSATMTKSNRLDPLNSGRTYLLGGAGKCPPLTICGSSAGGFPGFRSNFPRYSIGPCLWIFPIEPYQ